MEAFNRKQKHPQNLWLWPPAGIYIAVGLCRGALKEQAKMDSPGEEKWAKIEAKATSELKKSNCNRYFASSTEPG